MKAKNYKPYLLMHNYVKNLERHKKFQALNETSHFGDCEVSCSLLKVFHPSWMDWALTDLWDKGDSLDTCLVAFFNGKLGPNKNKSPGIFLTSYGA